jgi:hypothetical protein
MSQSTSLVKFMQQQRDGSGRGQVYWHRAGVDGYPFRGQKPPMLREDEYEQRVVKVGDPKNGIFDVNNPDDNRRYLQVLDRIVNGWAEMISPREIRYCDERKTWLVYLEWVEWFMEDGTPAAAAQQPQGFNHGTMPIQPPDPGQ